MNWLQKMLGSSPSFSTRRVRARLQVEALESRVVPYATTGNAWPNPQLVTLSFVPDGTNLGGVTSNLFSTFNARWATSMWQAQFTKAAQMWAQQTNLNFAVVSDNGGDIGSGNYEQGDPGFGDIRIGGYNFGTNSLAAAYQPPPVNNYSIAGDIQFNTGAPFNIGSTYDLFTVAMHEIGHALGMDHSTNSYAVMYPTYTGKKTALNSDDISGIQSIYGGARKQDAYDAAASNGSFSAATDITSTIDPNALTALVTGLDITTTSDLDYYKFTAPTGTSGSLTVSVQSSSLSLLAPAMTVYDANQVSLGSKSSTSTQGDTLTLTISNVTAGSVYYLKVAGANTSAFGTGSYAVVLNFGTGTSPTVTPPNTKVAQGSTPSSGGGSPLLAGNTAAADTFSAAAEQHTAPTQTPAGSAAVVPAAQVVNGAEAVAIARTLVVSAASSTPVVLSGGPAVTSMSFGTDAGATGSATVLTLGLTAAPATKHSGTQEARLFVAEEETAAPAPMASPALIRSEGQPGRKLTTAACDACFTEPTWQEGVLDSGAAVADPEMAVPFDGLAAAAGIAVALGGFWRAKTNESERRRQLAQI